MGNPTAFKELPRELPPVRDPKDRVNDWKEIGLEFSDEKRKQQASRCMNCGIPFCNEGCPLGNLIPDWNDLIYRDQWKKAYEALRKTNNFPEFTGKICPAPCEASCVLGINEDPVTIKLSEISIIERAWEEGWVVPEPPESRTGKHVAVIGSGPAGLAAADQLNQAGHWVTVFERSPRVGGLLTFGIPDFKLNKQYVDRRVDIMAREGITFRTGMNVGKDVTLDELQSEFDAIVLAMGSTNPRNIPIPGRDLKGVHFAMEYLGPSNHRVYGDLPNDAYFIDAKDKHVLILGGGDTGADCYGTALRQGAKSVTQWELMPEPPKRRHTFNPWPEWPRIFKESDAHKEGGERDWSLETTEFLDDGKGQVRAVKARKLEWKVSSEGRPEGFDPDEKSEFEKDADLVFIAAGYVGPEKSGPIEALGIDLDNRGNIITGDNYMTRREGIFAAGDARRGQSLVVWAIAEGRKAARGVDEWLMGHSDLPG